MLSSLWVNHACAVVGQSASGRDWGWMKNWSETKCYEQWKVTTTATVCAFLCCIFDLWWIFCAFLFPGELHCCRLDGRSSVSSNVQLGFWRTVWEHVCSGWKPFSISRGNQITQPTHSKFPTLINLLKIPNHYIPKPHNRSCPSDGLVPHPAHPDYFLWKSLHL